MKQRSFYRLEKKACSANSSPVGATINSAIVTSDLLGKELRMDVGYYLKKN